MINQLPIENVVLPGNPRYQPKALQGIFGYDNLYRHVATVEMAVLDTLFEIGIIPKADMELLTGEMRVKIAAIRTTDVDRVEREVTHHDIRAWVRLAQEILPLPLRRWVHVPLTSFDALDTARALQFKDAYQQALQPAIKKVFNILGALIVKHAATPQIGRTHGQHAIPITVGFWLSGIGARLLACMSQMQRTSEFICGKVSGPVGAYNAQVGLGFLEKAGGNFEKKVLDRIGLRYAPISSQIVIPESLSFFLFSCVSMTAVFGQLGRDCRHLMREEIGEIGEPFAAGQVGSSTMAQKRNPINFENLEGTWIRTKNEFGKVLDTLLSDHQRDLVGSSVARDFPIIIVNLMQQLGTLLRQKKGDPLCFLEKVTVNEEACLRNLKATGGLLMAEPLYIALQMAGYQGDAHELVNHTLVPIAKTRPDKSLYAALKDVAGSDSVLGAAFGRIPEAVCNLLACPELYTGLAAERALEIGHSLERFQF